MHHGAFTMTSGFPLLRSTLEKDDQTSPCKYLSALIGAYILLHMER